MRPAIKVGLSTGSVHPLGTEAAFANAAELGVLALIQNLTVGN